MDFVVDRLKDSFYALSTCICQPPTNLKLNGRKYKVLDLLGEGGFSYVYLAQDLDSGRKFALKKIRCPLGSDNAHQAMKEVEAYRKFRHPNCIRCLDSCVTQENDVKVIYLFLPYYRRGNLQDAISASAVNGSRFSERELLTLFLKTCEAVRAMHTYRPDTSATYPPTTSPQINTTPPTPFTDTQNPITSTLQATIPSDDERDDEEQDDEENTDAADAVPLIKDSSESDNILGQSSSTPTDTKNAGRSQRTLDAHPVSRSNSVSSPHNKGNLQPWAHRDIKPGNIMISDDGKQPILMDFGSAMPARISISNRSIALTQQDIAAEHSTMPYRAPELFDVKTDTVLDEKVDIWSLGCTLFAVAYGHSPFEGPEEQQGGGSIMLAVTSGKFRFPRNDDRYSQAFKDLISAILIVNPAERPDIHRVIELCHHTLLENH